MLSTIWAAIAAQLDLIRTKRPTTVAEVGRILGSDPQLAAGGTIAFFAGSGGDDQLVDALMDAGWNIDWIDGDYHYTATHPATGQMLNYVEGDIFEIAPVPKLPTH